MSTTPQQSSVVIPPVPQKVLNIKKVLEARQAQIAQACGKWLDPETLMRVAMTQIYRTPRLQECDPWSIVGALMEAAQLGLVAGGPQQEGYLIPRKNKNSGTVECTFLPGYRGLIKIAIDTGAAAAIDAHVVHSRDHFEFAYGITPFVDHRPVLTERGDRIAVYCCGKHINGEPFLDVLTPEDVEKAHKASQDPDSIMWKTYTDEAWRKTAIRRMCKRLKGTPRLSAALELEASQFGDAVTPPPQRPMPKRLSETRQSQPQSPVTAVSASEAETQEQLPAQPAEDMKDPDQSKFSPPPGWDPLAAHITELCGSLNKPDAVAEHLKLAMAVTTPEGQVAALQASVKALEAEYDHKAQEAEAFALKSEMKGKGR